MSENNGSAPPAGNPPVDGGNNAPPANTPPVADKWYSSLQDADLRGFAELKGWDTPDKAINSYKNLEKFQGLPPERLAKIPEAGDEAGWKDFNKRFGWDAPEDAKDYQIEVPEGLPTDYADRMREVFKANKVPKALAEALAKGSNEVQAALLQVENEAFNNKAANEMAQLKTEWGADFEKYDALGKAALKEFGGQFDETTLGMIEDVIGPAAAAKFWANIGSKIGEAKFVDGKTDQLGPMTPDAANVRLKQLMNDKGWMDRYQSGDVRAKQEYISLRDTIARAG